MADDLNSFSDKIIAHVTENNKKHISMQVSDLK